MCSTRLNPRLARLSFKLQHRLVSIEYLPGDLNTLADALSREEKRDKRSDSQPTHQQKDETHLRGMSPNRDIHFAAGDVKGTPPHEDRQEPEVA